MWKSRTKKAFSLIETTCSISLFVVLFFSAATIGLASTKIKAQGKEMKEMVELLEIVHDYLECNASYEDIKQLKENNKLILCNINLNYSVLKEKELISLFQNDSGVSGRRLHMMVEGDKVYKITLNFYDDSRYSTKPLVYEFYKGSYK